MTGNLIRDMPDPAQGDHRRNDGDRFCDHCGDELSTPESHPACRTARRLDPPHYCATCRRRMVVQVTPFGWTARCVEHGLLSSS